MKNLLYFIGLVGVFALTSCSKDDEEEILTLNNETIVGEWTDYEHETIYFFNNGFVDVINSNVRYEYKFDGNFIVFCEINEIDYSNSINFYKSKINEIKEELKTARGDRREYLIDLLNNYTSTLRCLETEQHNNTFYGEIIKKTLYDMEFIIDGEIYKLHRTSKHSNF